MLKQPERLIILFVLSVMFFTSIPFATTCYCNSCSSCTAALNNPTCTKVVLNRDVQLSSPSQVCIKSSIGFRNKVFDCQGHSFEYLGAPQSLVSIDTGIIKLNSTSVLPEPLNFTLQNCGFKNVFSAVYIKGVANITVLNTTYFNNSVCFEIFNTNNTIINKVKSVNCSSLAVIWNVNTGYSTLPSTIITDLKEHRYYLKITNVEYLNQTRPPLYIGLVYGGAAIINQMNTYAPILLSNITFKNVLPPTCNLTCWLHTPALWNNIGYLAYAVTGTKVTNWTGINTGFSILFDTFDHSFFSNSKLNASSVFYSNELEYDSFSNDTFLVFDGGSDGPTYVSPTYVENVLAFSKFDHIHSFGFSFDYSYKSNFTNIYVANGRGFLFPCGYIRTTLNHWYPQIKYSYSYGNRFINLTLINNTPYDLNLDYGNVSALVQNNVWKNISSTNRRPILVLSGNGLNINSGNYAEAVLVLTNSKISDIVVEGAEKLKNDGIILAGKNITLLDVKSDGNAIGLFTLSFPKTSDVKILRSVFNDNIEGVYLIGNNYTLNKDTISGNILGLAVESSHNKINNTKIQNNLQYDIVPFMLGPEYLTPGCQTNHLMHINKYLCFQTSFSNVTLSGERGLDIVNQSHVNLANKLFSEMIICSNYSKFSNITVVGNATLKNNGIFVMGVSNTFSSITSNHVNVGLWMSTNVNRTIVANSSFSHEQCAGVVVDSPVVWSSTLTKWINRAGYNRLQNITAEYNNIGIYIYSSSNTLNNISACFDKNVSFYFNGHSIDNTGSSNLGNITDLGTNPGFSADAGICYLSLLKPVFVPPTPANNSILSSTSITLNATSSDPTLTNITLNLYNNTGLVQKVICTSSPCSYSFTGLKLNQNYYFNATACDAEKQCASTSTYTTYLSPTTCALVLVVKNHLNKALYIDAVKIGSEEYNVGHVLLLPYQSKAIRIENNGFCQYLGKVVFLDMTIYFSDASHMTYEVSGEIALNS